jgi:glycosyltransferase involved in cell wall biosynthesis
MVLSDNSSRKLKILIIAPVALPIAGNLKYAGTERVIANLSQGLAENPDIKVVVAATGDSRLPKKVKLIYIHDRAIWPLNGVERKITGTKRAYEKHFKFCIDYATKNHIDIIHDHANLVSSRAYKKRKDELNIPIVTTLHGDVSSKEKWAYKIWRKLQKEKRPIFFTSISRSQKRKFEKKVGVKIFSFIHHGLDVEKYPFAGRELRQDYLFWIGRLSKDKGTDLAIKLAKMTGRPLIIAGEIHTPNREFYERKIKPHITRFIEGENPEEKEKNRGILVNKLIKGKRIIGENEIFYIGPLNDRQKNIINSRSYANIMLNRWEEPFGLTMPEAMATGTPVIGTKRGSIPEIVIDKETGYVLQIKWKNKERGTIDESNLLRKAIKALDRIKNISPLKCRRHIERHFSSLVMAGSYLELYKSILSGTTKDLKNKDLEIAMTEDILYENGKIESKLRRPGTL